MKCKKCGHDEFNGHQLVRADIVVDEHGNFLRNHNNDLAKNVYDSERPYGPFCCLKCGAEYDELEADNDNPAMVTEDAEKSKAIQKAMILAMFGGKGRS